MQHKIGAINAPGAGAGLVAFVIFTELHDGVKYNRLTWDEALLFQPLIPAGLLVVLFRVTLFALFDKRALPAVRRLAVSTGALSLLWLCGRIAFFLFGFISYRYGELSPVWWVVFVLPWLLLLLTVGLAVFILRPWPGASVLRRTPNALAVVAAGGVLRWSNYWNLLGLRF